MKKIFNRKFLCMCMALVLCVALAVPAFATGSDPVDPEPDPDPSPAPAAYSVTGTSFDFIKALIIDENANVPEITFEYTIAAGEGIAASNGKMEVIAPSAATGVTGAPAVNSAIYAPGDETVTTYEGVTIESGEKAAIKTLTVDFSGVSFTEPGIYRYVITETSADQQGIAYDTQAATPGQKTRVLDVYVIDTDGVLSVANYVLHETADDVATGEDLGSDGNVTKSLGFVNSYTTYDISLSKTVAGNQASHDKYFKFTVAIANAGANVSLDIDMSNAETAPSANPATIYTAEVMAAANGADDNANIDGLQWNTDENGAVTKVVYLKHGQTVVIKGLADGATYTITEDYEDYKSNAENGAMADTDGMDADAAPAFVNTRQGVIPTGVAMSALGGIAVATLGGLGIFAFAKKSKKEDEE